MEHCRFYICFFLVISFFGLAGCRSEDPNPELKDPIYQSLKKEADDSQKALTEAEKAKDEAYARMKATPAQTIELREAEKEYWKAVKSVESLKTAVRYLKIRSERRRIEARLSYKQAFIKGEEKNWPDPGEYSNFLINKRLREASLNWNRRVPKLQDRIPSSKEE